MVRRVFAALAVAVGFGFGAIGLHAPSATAQGHPLEETRGLIQRLGLAPLLCAGTPLAPTLQCAIYDPDTETYFNPYTEDGSSPGLLGFGSLLGLL